MSRSIPLILLLLLGAIAVAVLGAFRYSERQRLRTEILRPRETGTDGGAAARDTVERLARSLGLAEGTEAGIRERLLAIVAAFGDGEAVPERATEVSITTGWDRLPELVAWIAERPSIPLEELTATPGPGPDRCRVRIRLGHPAAGFGPR